MCESWSEKLGLIWKKGEEDSETGEVRRENTEEEKR
jgi:hypothetical protein